MIINIVRCFWPSPVSARRKAMPLRYDRRKVSKGKEQIWFFFLLLSILFWPVWTKNNDLSSWTNIFDKSSSLFFYSISCSTRTDGYGHATYALEYNQSIIYFYRSYMFNRRKNENVLCNVSHINEKRKYMYFTLYYRYRE
jgi:hypothetical protein